MTTSNLSFAHTDIPRSVPDPRGLFAHVAAEEPAPPRRRPVWMALLGGGATIGLAVVALGLAIHAKSGAAPHKTSVTQPVAVVVAAPPVVDPAQSAPPPPVVDEAPAPKPVATHAPSPLPRTTTPPHPSTTTTTPVTTTTPPASPCKPGDVDCAIRYAATHGR